MNKIIKINKLNNKDKELIPSKIIDSNVDVKCVNLYKEYRSIKKKAFPILENINIEILSGEIAIILGPSGSGKTTLLNAISGIDIATKGKCYIKGVNINKISGENLVKMRKKHIAYVYQKYGLIPILTCIDNIRMSQNLVPKENRVINIDEIVKIVGIDQILHKFPHEISGGQRQRVAIARAIVKQPDIMICDEPTGALDSITSKKIIELFYKINKLYKTTIVMVTHDNEISAIANRLIYIKDGKIEDNKSISEKERNERIKKSKYKDLLNN